MQPLPEYKVQFEEAYTSYYSRMKRFAMAYVIREEDAENIVQDVFYDLWEKKQDLRSFVHLNSFLFVTLKNRCIDFLRHKTMEQRAINEIQREYQRSLKLKFESLDVLNDKLLADPNLDGILQKAIDQLPEKCRRIFFMNKMEGKRQKAIAAELDLSIHTIESQMAIAYKKLKESLKDYLPLFLFFFL